VAFTDNFDGAGSNTNLESWTPSGGGSWTRQDGAAGAAVVNTNGTLRSSSTTATSYVCTDQGSANHAVEFRDKAFANTVGNSLAAVRLVDASNSIGWRITGTGATGRRLCKIVAGVITDLITSQAVDEEWIKVEISGTTAKLFQGGTGGTPSWTQVGADQTVSDSVFSGETSIGVRIGSSQAIDWIDEFSASALGGTPVTISCTPGNAVAAGSAAVINSAQLIACTVGDAIATGVSAAINNAVTIVAIPGNAAAAGQTANINSAVTVTCTLGNAQAAGITAAIEAGGAATITCSVGDAIAAGALAAIASDVIIGASIGNAVAAGLDASIVSAATITCTVGDAAGAGVTATITTSGAVTVTCTPGNAVAAGIAVSISGGMIDFAPYIDRRLVIVPAAARVLSVPAGIRRLTIPA
jgi:hypothetical protein